MADLVPLPGAVECSPEKANIRDLLGADEQDAAPVGVQATERVFEPRRRKG
jgi:hypothetical protein